MTSKFCPSFVYFLSKAQAYSLVAAALIVLFGLLGSPLGAKASTGDGSKPAAMTAETAQKELEVLKRVIDITDHSPRIIKRYNLLASVVSKCSLANQLTAPAIKIPFAPLASLCINGTLATTDPTYNRVLAASTGTGVGNGTAGNCTLSGSGTATYYDAYTFNLQGCAAFPTAVTAQLCGPAGCAPPATVDTVLTLYRNVSAGDPLTANGGLASVFNPASACTNARAANDDSGSIPTSTGGSTCNQTNTADCLAQCAASTSLSEFKRSLGNGLFTVVVTSFGNGTVGNYNLYLDAPAAGCTITQLTATAAGATIGGIVTAGGKALANARVTLTGTGDRKLTVTTNAFGKFSFPDLDAGATYVVSVAAKNYTFAPQVVTLRGNVSGLTFTAQ